LNLLANHTTIRRKVLHIHASAILGGTELRAFQIASRLNDTFDLFVLFHCPPGLICDSYKQAGISFEVAPFPWPNQILRRVREFRPDVIHIFGLKTNVLWRPILYSLGYRHLIGHIAGLTNIGENPSWLRLKADLWTHWFLSTYLSNSENVKRRLLTYGFSPSILRVIHNGVELPNIYTHPSNQIPIILSVGNLRPVKGHRYLLDALKIMRDQNLSFESHIVGIGPEMPELKAMVKRLDLTKHVHFLGQLKNEELLRRMGDCDVFALLSLSEGISGAAMEAMAQGVPIVATEVGGMSELIENGREGFLVPPRNASQAAEHLTTLVKDPALRKELGDNARTKIERTFNISKTVHEYANLYVSRK
jgi:glycosyltransferase involved in cell wall biosynthesis